MSVRQGVYPQRTKAYHQRLNSKSLGRNPEERRYRPEETVNQGEWSRRSVIEVSTLLGPRSTQGPPPRPETPAERWSGYKIREDAGTYLENISDNLQVLRCEDVRALEYRGRD